MSIQVQSEIDRLFAGALNLTAACVHGLVPRTSCIASAYHTGAVSVHELSDPTEKLGEVELADTAEEVIELPSEPAASIK
jgi:hypothetical protein